MKALIARVRTSPHPNADRLALGQVEGYQVLVNKATPDGTLGILFPAEAQVSHGFVAANNLYRKPEWGNNNPAATGGYLEADRRIRTLKLRGQVSEGLWLDLGALDAYSPGASRRVKEGDEIDSINGLPLCAKYITPATSAARKSLVREGAGAAPTAYALFPQHFDTPQVRNNLRLLAGKEVIITEKVHGTSGRSGNVPVLSPRPWWQRLLAPLVPAYREPIYRAGWTLGTRRVIVRNGQRHGEHARNVVHEALRCEGRVCFYYEIVGWLDDNTTVMPRFVVDGKDEASREIAKRYGSKVDYTYGCAPGTFRVFLYRVTAYRDGMWVDEPFEAVKHYAAMRSAIKVETPPVLFQGRLPDDPREVARFCNDLANLPSTVCPTIPAEGICIRVDDKKHSTVGRKATLPFIYKWKSFDFCHLEGIRKNDPEYIDTEEGA